MTGKGHELWRAGLREAVYWLPLMAAVVFLVVAMNGGYLGECTAATGYEPELGFMAGVPWLLGFSSRQRPEAEGAGSWTKTV